MTFPLVIFSERTMMRLVDFMDAKNISQRDLADALNVSEAHVSQMLSAKSNLTLKTVDKIEAAFIDILNRRPIDNFIFVGDSSLKRNKK